VGNERPHDGADRSAEPCTITHAVDESSQREEYREVRRDERTNAQRVTIEMRAGGVTCTPLEHEREGLASMCRRDDLVRDWKCPRFSRGGDRNLRRDE
jgi:hypothetical protein